MILDISRNVLMEDRGLQHPFQRMDVNGCSMLQQGSRLLLCSASLSSLVGHGPKLTKSSLSAIQAA